MEDLAVAFYAFLIIANIHLVADHTVLGFIWLALAIGVYILSIINRSTK